MDRLALAVLTMLLAVGPARGGDRGPAGAFATYTFGISLATGHHSELFSCFIVKELNGEVIATDPVTREQFLQQVRGMVPSKANPTGEDLFATHGITACMVQKTEDGGRVVPYCTVLDDLWKLRFWEYPLQLRDGQRVGKGWAEQPLCPSPRQMLLLSTYGLHHPTDLCHGEAMFRLLRDVSDPEWADNYRKGL